MRRAAGETLQAIFPKRLEDFHLQASIPKNEYAHKKTYEL